MGRLLGKYHYYLKFLHFLSYLDNLKFRTTWVLTAVDAKNIATGSIEGDLEQVTDDEEFIVRRGNSLSTASRSSLSR